MRGGWRRTDSDDEMASRRNSVKKQSEDDALKQTMKNVRRVLGELKIINDEINSSN